MGEACSNIPKKGKPVSLALKATTTVRCSVVLVNYWWERENHHRYYAEYAEQIA